jgi:hypothetical protein
MARSFTIENRGLVNENGDFEQWATKSFQLSVIWQLNRK